MELNHRHPPYKGGALTPELQALKTIRKPPGWSGEVYHAKGFFQEGRLVLGLPEGSKTATIFMPVSTMNWNQKIFFWVNKWVGKSPILDTVGRFSAEYAILVMVAVYGLGMYAYIVEDAMRLFLAAAISVVAWVAAWVLNVFIGLMVREPRPHVSNPRSRLLFTPLMSWKSFPSDHAMTAWLLVFLGHAFYMPFWPALLILAVVVSFGRVFAGVHYPLDIVGGCAVAALVTQVGKFFVL